jgi:hypothetical protein
MAAFSGRRGYAHGRLKAERGQPGSHAAYFARKMQSALAKLQIA